MSKETKEDERINSILVEVRILESTYNELTSRQNMLERAMLENRAALDAIRGLEHGGSEEVLMQIGGGALLRAPTPATDRVLVNVGSGIVIEKSKEEAVALMEGRAREVERSVVSLINQRNEIAERLEADRQLLETLLARKGQKG